MEDPRQSLLILRLNPHASSAGVLERALLLHGVASTAVPDLLAGSSPWLTRSVDRPLVVLFSMLGESAESFRRAQEQCRALDLSCVRIVVDERLGFAEVGPVFHQGMAPCYECFLSAQPDLRRSPKRSLPPPSAEIFWCALMAPLLQKVVNQHLHGPVEDHTYRATLPHLRIERRSSTFSPSCLCRQPRSLHRSPASVPRETYAALLYEDWVTRQTTLAPPTEEKKNFVEDLLRASVIPKQYPNSRRVALAPAAPLSSFETRPLPHEAHPEPRPLALPEVISLLRYTAGHDVTGEGAIRRFAASAGNLGSVELHLLAQNLDGLRDGLYTYRAAPHDLVSLNPRGYAPAEIVRLCGSLAQPEEGAAVTVCLTGSYSRLRAKYGAFAYRLIHLDAGVAFRQASLVAQSLGLWVSLLPDSEEGHLARALNLSGTDDFLTAVLRLSTRPAEVRRSRITLAEKGECTSRPLSQWAHFDENHLVQHLHAHSVSNGTDWKPALPLRGRPLARETELPVVLPMHAALTQRRSVRHFSSEPVPRDFLLALIREATRIDEAEWNNRLEANHLLRFFVLETNGARQSRELLAYDPETDQLRSLLRDLSNRLPLYGDSIFETAPAAVWIVGDLHRATALFGEYGHRNLLFRAGAAANYMWLSAIACGYANTITAGLLSRPARLSLDMDGWDRLALCALPLGRERTAGNKQARRAEASPLT